MPLIINKQRVSADSWTDVTGEEQLSLEQFLLEHSGESLLLSWEQWQNNRQQLLADGRRLGVRIANDLELEELSQDLEKLSLIAVDFPMFGDGRAFSQARLLRQRYGFSGQIRATGDVTWDRLNFMQRCGIDAFEIADNRYSDEMLSAFDEITVHMQGAADDPRPIYRQS